MSTGLVISVPGVDWSNKNLGILLSVPDGAEYLAKYNSMEDLTRNLVPGKSPATVTGAPIIQEGVAPRLIGMLITCRSACSLAPGQPTRSLPLHAPRR